MSKKSGVVKPKKTALVRERKKNKEPSKQVPKSSEIIAARIRGSIVRGEMMPGDTLPPEAELIRQFKTSRPTLREAYRILETEQFISIKRGARSGARVHLPEPKIVAKYAGYVLQIQGTQLRDIYQSRLAVEPLAVRLLAEKGLKRAVKKLTKHVDVIEADLESHHYVHLMEDSLQFSEHLVELTGNKTLQLMFTVIERVVESHQFAYGWPPSPEGSTPQERLKRGSLAVKSMRKVTALIEKRDATAAAAHWREHIEFVNRLWLVGFDDTQLVDVIT